MNSNELRKLFLDFFREKGHEVKPSFSLIPDDPSLLFTVAGMVPFKNYFLGKVPLTFTRAATAQKCIRTNDIENVGRTRRHHTFFEMLGNFSFGDYFKEETVAWAWEFLTDVIKLPKNRMYVTVYKDDDEAFEIWNKKMKVPAERIFRMGKDSNFWEMGTVGPCGYCSEIYFDLEGGEKGDVTADDIENNDDRFLEIWNLVFTAFDKKEDGTLGDLAQKNIDTGMGFERLAAVSQGVYSNYESDLFMPLIKDVSEKANIEYGKSEKTDVSLRVIADHARGVSFLIGDGVMPSNEGRGYVLRRIIRRAVRHGRLLGIKEPFLYKVVPAVVRMMGEAYPEILDRKDYITQIISLEEDKFQETMDKGMDMLNAEIETLKKSGKSEFEGEVAFKLYDTFGFPVEITEEILEENGMTVDKEKFKECMEKQREMAKKAWKGANTEIAQRVPESILRGLPVTTFSGYDAMRTDGCKVLAVAKDKKEAKSAKKGDEVHVVFDKSPFYAESGGQIGDTGVIEAKGFKGSVLDTQKVDERFVHTIKITEGELKTGDIVDSSVDRDRRKAIMRNHTTTHMLHAVLREILGTHVEQAGSFVGPDRMRFDFTHFAQLTDEEIRKTEKIVNKWILEGYEVKTVEMDFKEAKANGAMALFDDKYKDRVRTVTIGDISMELCAGTHLNSSSEAGIFKIISSGSTAAGVRRIEACTGTTVFEMMSENDDLIKVLKDKFKVGDVKSLDERITKLVTDNKTMEKKMGDIKKADLLKNVDSFIAEAKEINGIKVITLKFEGADKDVVRDLGDILKSKVQKGVFVIANIAEGKVNLLAMVTDDLTDKMDASKIVKAAAALCKGGGGGRKDMAEAGGKDPSKVDEALKKVEEIVAGG